MSTIEHYLDGLRHKQAELDNVYPLLIAAEQKNATYAHELNLLRSERDRLEYIVGETDDQSGVINDLRNEIEGYRQDVNERDGVIAELHGIINRLRSQIDHLNRTHPDCGAQLFDLQEENAGLRTRIQELEGIEPYHGKNSAS